MTYKEYKETIEKDIQRWGKTSFLALYLTVPEFKLMWRHRLVSMLRSYVFLRPLYQIERFLYHRSCVRCGCDIPSHCKIGAGVKILHGWGIVINSKTIIGENFTIVSGTVIGANHTGFPTIGDNVSIGAHALIIGGVDIGNNSEIGAGAIVTHDIPENGVVYGEASKVRKIK